MSNLGRTLQRATGVGGGLTVSESQALFADTFQPRLVRASATVVDFTAVVGRFVGINGEMVNVSAFQLSTTDNLIDANGDELAATPMGASTLFYVYVSNSLASFAPSDLRASTTPPTVINVGDISNTQFLGAGANARNWRFVGWVRTSATTEFVDTPQARFVVNYYNRQKLSLFNDFNYVDDAASTSFTHTGSTYIELNGGTNDQVEYIANGEDAVFTQLSVFGRVGLATAFWIIAIGRDTNVNPVVSAFTDVAIVNEGGPATVIDEFIPTVGYHNAQSLGVVTAGQTLTVFADTARNGAAADVKTSFISGHVMG